VQAAQCGDKLQWRQNSSDPNQLMTAAPDYRRNTITVIYKVLPLLAYTKNTYLFPDTRSHRRREGERTPADAGVYLRPH